MLCPGYAAAKEERLDAVLGMQGDRWSSRQELALFLRTNTRDPPGPRGGSSQQGVPTLFTPCGLQRPHPRQRHRALIRPGTGDRSEVSLNSKGTSIRDSYTPVDVKIVKTF